MLKLKLQSFAAVGLALAAPPSIACDGSAEEPCPSVSFEAAYTGELWRNVTGGLEVGNAYLDTFDLVADFSGERLFNLPELQLHAHLQYNNGREFSARYVGDLQAVSNIESVDTWRPYEFWLDYRFGARSKQSLRFGLYDLNSEFDVLDSAGLFVNSSHGIGVQIAQTGLNGPSIFPITSLALRWSGSNKKFYWQAAALDAVPGDRDNPTRTGVHLSSEEGLLLVGEFGAAIGGLDKLGVGYWRYSEDFDSIDEFDAAGDPVRRSGNSGVYALAEGELWSRGSAKLTGFARIGTAAERFNTIGEFVGAGLVLSNAWSKRPDDQWGIAIASGANGSRWRRAAALAGSPVERRETAIEFTWRAPINDWLTLQPDVQWVKNPGTDPGIDDAWAFGLRFEVSASWSQ